MAEFITGTNGGYFCPQCPTVVLDTEEFARLASAATGNEREAAFSVIGIVDLEAVPANKRNRPFDPEDNPLPLVEFTNAFVKSANPREQAEQRAKMRRKLKKKAKKRK